MKNKGRKAGLILAAVCFMAAATNLTLALHLESHKHDKGHHSEHCQTCQQSTVLKEHGLLTAPADIVFSTTSPVAVHYGKSVILEIIDFRFPPLRAPPAIL